MSDRRLRPDNRLGLYFFLFLPLQLAWGPFGHDANLVARISMVIIPPVLLKLSKNTGHRPESLGKFPSYLIGTIPCTRGDVAGYRETAILASDPPAAWAWPEPRVDGNPGRDYHNLKLNLPLAWAGRLKRNIFCP